MGAGVLGRGAQHPLCGAAGGSGEISAAEAEPIPHPVSRCMRAFPACKALGGLQYASGCCCEQDPGQPAS